MISGLLDRSFFLQLNNSEITAGQILFSALLHYAPSTPEQTMKVKVIQQTKNQAMTKNYLTHRSIEVND